MGTDIDVILPYIHTKRYDGIELKMALRSLEKNLIGYRHIWIIGNELPLWMDITKIKQIRCGDNPFPRFKERNIFNKIMVALNHGDVSENVFFTNDDLFLLKPIEVAKFPYFHRGELYDSMLKNKGTYRGTLNHSRTWLLENNLPTLDYDVHAPVIYNKNKFIKSFERVDFDIDFGFAIKSVYCNTVGVNGIQTIDLKITKGKLRDIKMQAQGRDWFSTGTCNKDVELFLASTFPKKSKYEY